ncbi:MAG: hypothetical protein ACR2GT_06665, partial [Gaiellaceae bacterium]
MSELELRLVALGDEIDFPPTPALSVAVERAVALAPARRRRLRPLALALAIVLVAALGLLALSPGARSAFLELFHLRGATVSRVEELPEVELVERAELLGVPVTLAAARRQAGFELADLGEPDEVYLRGDGLVTFVYGSIERPRLLLSQVRGRVWDGFVKKVGARGTSIEEVEIEGERGLFVSGEPHFVMYLDSAFRIQEERAYLAGTTLLWNRGEVLLRLEADVGLAE